MYDLCDGLPVYEGCSAGYLAEYYYSDTDNCNYASTDSVDSITPGQFSYADGSTEFSLTYENDDDSYCLTVVMLCDATLDTPVGSAIYSNGTGTCAEYTELAWKSICPVYSVNALVTLLSDYYWIIGICALVAGFFFIFFGLTLIKVVVFLCGVILTIMVVFVLFYGTFMADNTEVWAFWTITGVSAVLGIALGILMVYSLRFGAAVLCAWGGFMLGILINEMWLYMYGSQALFWIVASVVAVICGLLAFIVFEPSVMFITAFLGSYFACRGLSMFVGGFPSAFELQALVENHAIDTVDPVFYAYLAGIVILTIIGFIVQWKIWKKKEDKDAHPYEGLN